MYGSFRGGVRRMARVARVAHGRRMARIPVAVWRVACGVIPVAYGAYDVWCMTRIMWPCGGWRCRCGVCRVWRMARVPGGVWRDTCGVWRVARISCGVWRYKCGVWLMWRMARMAYGVWRVWRV